MGEGVSSQPIIAVGILGADLEFFQINHIAGWLD